MEFSAEQIAQLIGGKVIGDPNSSVSGLAKIEEGTPGALAFLSHEKYVQYIYDTDASVVIIDASIQLDKPVKPTCTLVEVENARLAFAKLLEAYQQYKGQKSGIELGAHIHESAKIGENCFIGAGAVISAGAVIGNGAKIHSTCFVGDHVKIGENTLLHPGARVLEECVIGAECTLHSGVIIGGDGFGFAPNQDNQYHKVVHVGNVVVEDHVEIGSNTTVDRGTLGSTVIRKGVKLDNLIQIAHNVEIGENTVIAAQTGIAGSTKIGRDCMIGGQVGIIGHLTIANGVKIAAQSGIGHDITEEGTIVQGSPAFEIGQYKRSYVLFRGLPKLKEKISTLEKELKNIVKQES